MSKIFRAPFILLAFSFSLVKVYAQSRTTAYEFTVRTRFHSLTYFPYSGAFLAKNFNFDVNVNFEVKSYGVFLFRSTDLEDSKSIANYLQPGVYKNFAITPNLKVGPYAGYVFSQTGVFKDADSDFWSAIIATWTPVPRVTIENTLIAFNLSAHTSAVNRLFVNYQVNGFRFDVFLWERVSWEPRNYSTSMSVGVNFPLVKLGEHFSIQNSISYQSYLTRNKPDFAMKQGVLFSVIVPFTRKRDF